MSYKTDLEKELAYQKDKYVKMVEGESKRQIEATKKLRAQVNKIRDLVKLQKAVDEIVEDLDTKVQNEDAENVHDLKKTTTARGQRKTG